MSDDAKKPASAARRGKRQRPPAPTRAGELWAKCPECRMPVKDAELFTHLLNCPGAEVRQAEWRAEQATAKPDPQPSPEAETP